MCFKDLIKEWRKKRRDRIYEGPFEDGGTKTNVDLDAPKKIDSSSLSRFSCKYSTLSFLEEDTGLRCGVYYVEASKDNDRVILTVACSEGIDTGARRTEARPLAFLATLDGILKKYDVAAHNGYYSHTNALPDFYGVNVEAEYSSGEILTASDNNEVFLPIEFLRELCIVFGIENAHIDNE